MTETKTAAGKKGLSLGGNGIILVILASMAMMVMFIEIMLVPALSIIASEFNNHSTWISWILSIYLLVGAVTTPIIGRLGDLYGKKKVLLATMVIYIIALLGCSISWNLESLLFFRAVQGIGLGMFPLAFGIVRDTFPKEQVPVAIGIISAMFSVGVSIGLLGGGFIVSTFSWRYSFYIVAPLFAILAIASYFLIKDEHRETSGSIDYLGAGFLGLGVLSLLLGLTEGENLGWSSFTIIGLFIISIIALANFGLWQTMSRDPIIRLRLLKNRGLLGSNLTALFVGMGMFLMFQTLPFFLLSPKAVGGLELENAFIVGLYIFPAAAVQLIFAPLAGRIGRSIGHFTVLIIGMGVMALSFIVLVLLHSSEVEILVSMVVAGIGMGFSMVPLINIVALASPKKDFATASGMNTLFRVVGGSIGPVLASAILASYVVFIPHVPIPFYSEAGYEQAWLVGAIISFVGMIIAFTFRPRKGAQRVAVEQEAEVSKA